MNLICIKCPRGCNLEIQGDNVLGNLCPRGIDYAREEQTCPMRCVTALVKVDNSVVPVKTDREVPKDKIQAVLDEIAKIHLKSVKCGDVVVSNILNTGANIIVTGNKYN